MSRSRSHEAVLDKVQARLDRNLEAMTLRRSTVEHPFGTIKCWMGATHFLTMTLPKVATEMALNVLAYNMKRVVNLIGVDKLLEVMRAMALARSKSARALRLPGRIQAVTGRTLGPDRRVQSKKWARCTSSDRMTQNLTVFTRPGSCARMRDRMLHSRCSSRTVRQCQNVLRSAAEPPLASATTPCKFGCDGP